MGGDYRQKQNILERVKNELETEWAATLRGHSDLLGLDVGLSLPTSLGPAYLTPSTPPSRPLQPVD